MGYGSFPSRNGRCAGLALAAACCASGAPAQTSAAFDVSATIQTGCGVDGVTDGSDAGTIGVLDFGTDSALSTATRTANVAASQAIRLRCTPGAVLNMRIDGGQYVTSGVRAMQLGTSTAQRLQYRLYRDAGFTQEIVINVNVPITVTAANMNDVRLPVYARLVLPGNRQSGIYTDRVLVTLDW